MTREIPDTRGFSPQNLRYIKAFYALYSEYNQIFPQVAGIFDNNRQRLVDDLKKVPWDHHRRIIDKCKDNPRKAYFYVRKAIENDWLCCRTNSRAWSSNAPATPPWTCSALISLITMSLSSPYRVPFIT